MLHTEESWFDVDGALRKSRLAASAWAGQSVAMRLGVVRRARQLMAQRATAVASTVSSRSNRDTLVCELLPLLDAMRFLERRAKGLLATQPLRGGKPLWLFGVTAEIQREPLGVILILGPANYPLFLPCVQAIQALVAGNAVCLKPARGGEAAAVAVAIALIDAGLPPDVLQLLDTDAGPEAVTCHFDRIVLTGSAQTGIKVFAASAARLTPATMELSGCDAAFVMQGAEIDLVARCLVYGLTLNSGATCIAPRRIFVLENMAGDLERAIVRLLPAISGARTPAPIAQRLSHLLHQAVRSGARIIQASPDCPAVLADARCDMQLLQEDVFAPWLAIVPVVDMASAIRQAEACPYALGASIFGPLAEARELARQVKAGSVCINDVIVPTADPRLPFGGSGRSGFGRTRGAEGLLEMTAVKSVSMRRGRFRPHLAAPRAQDEARFATMIRLLHGKWFAGANQK